MTIAVLLPDIVEKKKKSKTNKSKGKKSAKILRVLLDSGASRNLIRARHITKEKRSSTGQYTEWNTSVGTFRTQSNVKLKFHLTEFSESKEITAKFSVLPPNDTSQYDIILGRTTLLELGMKLDFETRECTWDEVSIAMREPDSLKYKSEVYEAFAEATEPEITREATWRTRKNLDAHYEKANLPAIVNEQCLHQSIEERNEILR